ncbi:TBCK [Branchiostoma lanceolatum]|uniref:TBCK protein n=2 Tax=Branchiostoma lanceolatum TaxID=7740 RepID=A0A8K0A0P0_BRALA|nr:TBCK [Branchiostoma lanceolatum]
MCHQYDELLSSPAAHAKFKRILKAWVPVHVNHGPEDESINARAMVCRMLAAVEDTPSQPVRRVYDAVIQGEARVRDAPNFRTVRTQLERFHQRWNNIIGRAHPPLWFFLRRMKDDISANVLLWRVKTVQNVTNKSDISFSPGHIPSSINIPFNTAFSPEGDLVPCPAVSSIQQHKGRVVVVVGPKGPNAFTLVCKELKLSTVHLTRMAKSQDHHGGIPTERQDKLFKEAERPSTISTVVATDFSKAFDRVHHNTVVDKLLSKGLRPELVPWVCSFISGRRQRVRYHQSLSNWESLSCGVAQGTLLGPILFLVLIDDAASDTTHPVWKYVDDMNLLETRTLCELPTLQNALDDLHLWTQRNYMLLNGGKCLTMHVTFARNPPQPPPLRIDDTELAVVPSLKVLGLTIQSDLHWDKQVNNMVAKSGRKLFLLKRLKKFNLPQCDLVAIYIGYIRPILEYAVPVWSSGLTKRQSDQLERLQKRACRTIMGNSYTGYQHALEHLGLSTLATRREHLCLKFARSLMDSEFRDWLPPQRAQITGRVTRNNHKLNCPKVKTNRYLNSCIPYMTRLINKYDQ